MKVIRLETLLQTTDCTQERGRKRSAGGKGNKMYFSGGIWPIDTPGNQKQKEDICDELDKLETEINELKQADVKLKVASGPVTATFDTVLKTHKIAVQAYHGRSFIGNHCCYSRTFAHSKTKPVNVCSLTLETLIIRFRPYCHIFCAFVG